VYDWWSDHPGVLDLLYDLALLGREREFRRRSVDALELRPGERVLELGCGTGNSFAALRDAVGPDGLVVGVDASRGMVTSAAERIRRAGWENVHVVRGDASRPCVGADQFDAAYAAMSLSAMPDPGGVVDETATRLRPGGRLVVLDARPFQDRPWTALNPVVVPVSKWLTNWVPEVDLLDCLGRSFDSVAVTSANGGSILVARAETKRDA
jgi:demethylmenaquinone methyltransferase/2-methoxy-6-polyprenyl-1,4-benzoquinol methylase